MVEIRIAEEQDVGTFYEMMREEAAFHDSLQHLHTSIEQLRLSGFGNERKFGVLLASWDGLPAGYVSYTVNYSIWLGADFLMIDDVFVREGFRGRGIGEQLMLRAKELAQTAGYTRIRWGVESDNHGAIRFYRRIGASLHTKGLCTWDVAQTG